MKSLAFLGVANNGFSRWIVGGIVGAIMIASVYFATSREPPATQAAAPNLIESDEPIQPIESVPGLDPKKIDLGRKLFSDSRLSENDEISCATCHNLKTGGTDRKARLRLPPGLTQTVKTLLAVR